MKAEDEQRLQVPDNDYLKPIAGKSRRDRYRLIDLRKQLTLNEQLWFKIKEVSLK